MDHQKAAPPVIVHYTNDGIPNDGASTTYVQYAGQSPEGQAQPYYNANQGPPGGAPPSYAVASGFDAMPMQPPPGGPQMTPIAQSPHIMAPGGYYATPSYGQPMMVPPGVYNQPYAVPVGVAMSQPGQQSAQPVYVMNGQPAMMAAGVQAIPVQMAVAAGPKQSPLWLDGLCDICNSPSRFFWCAFFFPWLQYADNAGRSRLMAPLSALLIFGIAWIMFWIGFGIYGYFFFVGWLFMVFLGTHLRTRIRYRYGINGSQCDDCAVHCFCIPCAISQEARHIWDAEGRGSLAYNFC